MGRPAGFRALRAGAPSETPPRQHRCDVCGKVGAWGGAWQWHGSYRDLDEGRKIVRTCSAACRQQAKARKLIRGTAVRLDD